MKIEIIVRLKISDSIIKIFLEILYFEFGTEFVNDLVHYIHIRKKEKAHISEIKISSFIYSNLEHNHKTESITQQKII